VRGELSPLDGKTGTSMDVSLLIRYADDTMATISLSYNARQSSSGNVYICDGGNLVVSGRRVLFNGDVVFEAEENESSGILNQNREFIQAIREDRQASCAPEDGLRALGVLQQVYDQMITLEGEDRYRRIWGL